MLKQLANGDYQYTYDDFHYTDMVKSIIIPFKFIEQALIYHHRMPNTYFKFVRIFYAGLGESYWSMAFTGPYIDDPLFL